MRRILVTHRTVPLDRSEEYAGRWQWLRGIADRRRSARAWLFRRSGHEDHFIEFLEWQDPIDLLEDAEIDEALQELDSIAPGTREELEEA